MRCIPMKIKDVEKLVGISTHSIRFYEEMGLIKINRNPDSKYRDFSEDDVKKLKEIKLFRSLNITMEEIRRYYDQEISLQELMNHQLKELKFQHEQIQLKEELCEDIKKSKIPLISYTVNQYDEIMQHKKEKTPYQEANTMLAAWNKQENSKKRILLVEILIFPLVWILVSWLVFFIGSVPYILEHKEMVIQYHWLSFVITTLIALFISWSDYCVGVKLPNELYEFRENGIYYYDTKNKIQYLKLYKKTRKGDIESCFKFVPYEDVETFKVWFHLVAKTPVNGGNAYQLDFYIYTTQDDLIKINTGLIGVSDEKIKLTAEILKEYANKVIDPFHILDHLDLDNYKFYEYLDEVYRRREHKRVFGSS